MGDEKMEMGNKKPLNQCYEKFYWKKRKKHVNFPKSQVWEKKKQSYHKFATSYYKNPTEKLFQQILLKCKVNLSIISEHPKYFLCNKKIKSYVKTVHKHESKINQF